MTSQEDASRMSTGDYISKTVQSLLWDSVREDTDDISRSPSRAYWNKQEQLAIHLGVTHYYLPRKIQSGSWDAKDLDKLAEFFRVTPADFVPGKKRRPRRQ